MSLRIAVATEDFGAPLRDAIAQASRCRVQGVRLNVRTEVRPEEFSDTGLRQLRHYVGEHRLQTAGLMFSSRHALADAEHLDQRLDAIRAAMPLARKLGTSELLLRCGRIPNPDETGNDPARQGDGEDVAPRGPVAPTNSDVNSLRNPFSFAPTGGVALSGAKVVTEAQQFATLREILNDLCRVANHVGCRLQLVMSAYRCDRIERLIQEVTHGSVGLVFDPATAVMTGSGAVSVFRQMYKHVGYVRGRDAQTNIDGAGVEVPLGDGSIDWTELLPTLAEADYQGWFCIERTGGDSRAEDVRRGVEFVCQTIGRL